MHPPFRLITGLVLIALPLIEIALLIKSGQWLGFWPVILIIVSTGLLGARIIRTQGVATFRRISESMAAGREPHDALANGALLLLSGGLLVLPGPLTDTVGLILLVAPIRQWIARTVFKPASVGPASNTWRQPGASRANTGDDIGRRRRPRGSENVIEGEFERIDEHTVDPAKTDRTRNQSDAASKPTSD